MPRKSDNTDIETSDDAVTCESVEVIKSNEILGIDMEGAVQRLQEKYRTQYHLAWVREEDAKFVYNRWEYIKLINGGMDIEPCKYEDADKRKAHLVFCRRKREYQDKIDARQLQKNLESYKVERTALSKDNVQKTINTLGISGVGITQDNAP
jgi:hypothetical protein